MVLGLVLCLIAPIAALGGLTFVGGVVAVTVGLARWSVSRSIEFDHNALESYEARRRPQLES